MRMLKRLYEKNALAFALLWIGVYCVGMSIFDEASRKLGAEHLVSAIFAAILGFGLFVWIKHAGLGEHFGFCRAKAPARELLWYVPLALISVYNLWSGGQMPADVGQTLCLALKMLCVGFLEELIFRGFLFKAMCRDSVRWAILISGVTFGLGHILNLVNGSGMTLAENLIQIVGAMLIGILYAVIFWRCGSIWPCVISHGLFNAFSAFQKQTGDYILLYLLTIGYALVLLIGKKPHEKKQPSV
ncbi:MAG: CPBP family intramembrane metalloprotease [Oscillospiraceae bacterium]|nr:CPBP family intramembrane metalloprotease [Oscillospiraceae bacterium]